MDLQVDQPDFGGCFRLHSLPRSPARVHQTCTDLQIDENHVQTIIQTLFSSEKPPVSLPNLLVQIPSWSHTSHPLFSQHHSISIPHFGPFLPPPPKHTAADYFLPRKFISSQTEAGHASPARPPQTLQVSAPREICASIRRLDLPALHFRTRADLPLANPVLPLPWSPNHKITRSVTVSKIISYRLHAISLALSKFRRVSLLAHGFRITGPCLAVSFFCPSSSSPISGTRCLGERACCMGQVSRV
jgi:hypothetical protein